MQGGVLGDCPRHAALGLLQQRGVELPGAALGCLDVHADALRDRVPVGVCGAKRDDGGIHVAIELDDQWTHSRSPWVESWKIARSAPSTNARMPQRKRKTARR